MAELICADDYKDWVPDGSYDAQCVKFEYGYMYGSRRLFLHFKIIEGGEFVGKKVFMPFNMPNNKKIGSGFKYYRFWCMVNGWNKPSRNTMMSPKIFKSKVYQIHTRTVQPNGFPEKFRYSVVDNMDLLAG
jgi:hypothetical protein